MKKINLMITLILVSVVSTAQENMYEESMLKSLEMLGQATGDEYLQCAARFERIAVAEKERWIPYYHASYSLTLLSFDEPDGEKKDALLDRAQSLLDSALAIAPGESELHVLQAFIYPSRIMVDPMARGMIYMEKGFNSLETAKKLNPENPRAYFLEAVNKLNIPASMGGGPEIAKPIFQMAEAKFRAFSNENPLWPSWGEEANSAELEKL
jgi:hypothetical protein